MSKSWRSGSSGGSRSFRGYGISSSQGGSSGRNSEDESNSSSSGHQFSRNLSSLLRSSDRTSNLSIPTTSGSSSSRSSSFRSLRDRDNKSVDRSNSWRKSNFSSPVSYFSSNKHSAPASSSTSPSTRSSMTTTPSLSSSSSSGGATTRTSSDNSSDQNRDNRCSTLPWSYSLRNYQHNNYNHNQPSLSSQSSHVSSSSDRSLPPKKSSCPPSCTGSEDETSPRVSVSRTPSNASSVSWTPQSSSTTTLPSRRKVQTVQLLHITEPYRELINPNEVMINSSHEVFLAQPIITPIEQLRRKDKEVAKALEEKQKLIEEILNIPHEELESLTDPNNRENDLGCAQMQSRSAAEILLAALSQAKCLTSLVNRTLKLSEEEALHAITWRTQDAESKLESEQQKIIAKGEKLIEITTAINKQLTMLLAIVQENDRERENLKLELTRSQDQVRCLMSTDTPWSSPMSPVSLSSPLSPSPMTSKSSSPPLSDTGAHSCSGLSSLSR